MNDEKLKAIARKIAACLALAASDNPQEAENAKRRADALMRKYGLADVDVAAANASRRDAATGGKYRPPVYLMDLGAIVADAFGCAMVVGNGGGQAKSFAAFIGIGVKPELAAYTFEVLRRTLNKHRVDYIKAKLGRYKTENRRRMADLFCRGWCARIATQVRGFAGTEGERQVIDAYKQATWGDKLKSDKRQGAVLKKTSDLAALAAGLNAASDVVLHKPVQEKKGKALADQRQARLQDKPSQGELF